MFCSSSVLVQVVCVYAIFSVRAKSSFLIRAQLEEIDMRNLYILQYSPVNNCMSLIDLLTPLKLDSLKRIQMQLRDNYMVLNAYRFSDKYVCLKMRTVHTL